MRLLAAAASAVLLALDLGVFAQSPDIILADFEGTNYGQWTVVGEAFGIRPASGTLPGQMSVTGFLGHGLANSFHQGDQATGALVSAEFKIDRKYLKFLIGGGGWPDKTCLNLVVEGKRVASASGPNTAPGGSERLAWQFWDVGRYAGKSGRLEIMDAATGGWGHINVDQLVLTEERPPLLVKNLSRELLAKKRYLNLPVKKGAPKHWVSLLVDGRVERDFAIELAEAEPDWWAVLDLVPFRGKLVTIQVDELLEDSRGLSAMEQSDTLKGGENLYREALRPQFHFSPRRGWNNDPNGLVFYQGEYHLFFQHNPYGWDWGNMHWGHAISRDLVRWQELPEALYPDAQGTMFSGSAVVDWRNQSGLGRRKEPALLCFYTAAGGDNRLSQGARFTQGLAYSTDRGRTFSKYPNNPVVPHVSGGNRDPKVIWHPPSQRWIMTLYVETNKIHTIHFFGSTNLVHWEFLSRTDGLFECPDFFELPVDGAAAQRKWVLTAASSEYLVGSFDGVKFTPETAKLPGHRGRGFYAAQTFSDLPAKDGRRIQIGWLQAPSPGMPFNQAMSLPMELRLMQTAAGPRLTMSPVKELESLRQAKISLAGLRLAAGEEKALPADLVELRAEWAPGASETTFVVRGAVITYDPLRQELSVNGHRAPAPLRDGRQRLAIFRDRTSVEVFASDGLAYVPMPHLAAPEATNLLVRATGGEVKFQALTVYELKSAWGKP